MLDEKLTYKRYCRINLIAAQDKETALFLTSKELKIIFLTNQNPDFGNGYFFSQSFLTMFCFNWSNFLDKNAFQLLS
jgi:hypothetical protein